MRQQRPVQWLIDGHNLIFQFADLEDLQVTGRRAEARRALEARLRSFARRRGEPVLIVYDGNAQESNPDRVEEDLLATTYTMPPEEADDRIVYLARRHRERGVRVRVVTSDVRTLASHLPDGIQHVTATEFRERHLARRRPGKITRGDFSDVEAEFLRADGEETPPPSSARAPRPSPPASLPPPPPPAAEPSRPAAPSGPDEATLERIRKKKEKGRRHQKRRLERRRARRRS